LKYLLCHKLRKVPNFLHYYVWHKPSSKWHTDTVFVQIPTFVFFLFVCFFDFDQFIYNDPAYHTLQKKFVWRAEILQKLYIWNYILQGVTTMWYNIHL
jgi:hypothetical protein